MRFLAPIAVCVCVVSGVAFSAQPASERRIAALVVPMDKSAEALSLKLEGFINEPLNEFHGITVKTSDDLFGIPADDDANAALKRAETSFSEGKAAWEAKKFDDAEKKLSTALKEFTKAAPAVKACGHLCDTLVMYAIVLQARGEVEEAKIAILDLNSLGGTAYEVDRKKYPQDFFQLRAQVAGGRSGQLRGNVNVKSVPQGARVYLNNEFQGFTPMTVQTLPIGKALLRVERPGFKQFGTMVEVSTEDVDIAHELVATSGYKAYDNLLDKLASEVVKDKGGSTMSSLAKSLGLERGIVAILKSLDGGQTELTLTYQELKTGKRLAGKRATFQGDEFGQLKGEISRMVTSLMNTAEFGAEKVKNSGDPLENRSGTEEWNSEDKGGRTTTRDKKKKGDPLDSTNGTEDW